MADSPKDALTHAMFAGPGIMRERCRTMDWARTPLGDVRCWPAGLTIAAQTVLGGGFPMILLWGPELVQLFNDHYLSFLGVKHETALGQPTRDCWPEVWHLNAPIYERVLAGDTVTLEDAHFPLQRHGPAGATDDVFITLSYSPLPEGAGGIGGVLVTLFDTTAQVHGRVAQADKDALAERLYGAMRETSLVLQRTRDPYLLLDAGFRIRTINSSAERLLNCARLETVGRSFWDVVPDILGTEREQQYRRVASEGVGVHFLHRHIREDGDVHLEVDAYPASGGGVAIFWRDVSDRVRLEAAAETARAEAESRAATLAAIVQSIPDALLVGSREGVFLANDAARRLLSVSSEGAESVPDNFDGVPDLLNAVFPFEELLSDRETGAPVPLQATPMGRAFNGTRSHGHFLLRARGTSGVLRPVRAAAAPVVAPTGAVTGVVTILTDMTSIHRAAEEREQLLSKLDAERMLLRTILTQLPAAVFVVEAPSGRILEMNGAVAHVWGEPNAMTGQVENRIPEWIGFHADGRRVASDEWPVSRAVRGETVTNWTGAIERPDGRRVLIEASAAPVRNAAGKIVAAVTIANDITARHRVAREREELLHALSVERARLAYVFQNAPAFLAVVRGPTHVFELANDAYYELVGKRALIGKTVDEALPEVRGQGFLDLIDDVLASGTPFVGREVPFRLARTAGDELEVRFVDFVYLPLIEADGTRSGVIAHGTDVTEQVDARQEIERLLRESERARADAELARHEAEEANRGKSEFLAVMSHELRTPLNAIGGYAELIAMGIRGPVTAAQLSDLERIQISQQHLLALINRVLNYAMIDAGVVPYDVTDVPLDALLTTCEALVIPQAAAKRIALSFSECDTQLRARADQEKLRQVVLNLLSNALKFTEPGGSVSLSCASMNSDGAEPQIAIRVRDTGRGIAPDQLQRVFQPFVQVDARLTRAQEGTGLGLAISRELAQGMGGDLFVESTLGDGSTFTLILPAA